MRNEREINRIEKSVNGSYLGDVLNFHRKRVYAARISVILAFVVSAVTMLQLMHPAESLARDIVCGLEETAGHIHDESCYDGNLNLVCGMQEGEGAHYHTDECYELQRMLIYEEPEYPGYTADDSWPMHPEEIRYCGEAEHSVGLEYCAGPEEMLTQAVSPPGSGCNFTLSFDADAFEGASDFAAVALESASEQYAGYKERAIDAVRNHVGDGSQMQILGIYDLSVLDADGAALQPLGPVNVRADFGAEMNMPDEDGTVYQYGEIYAVHFAEVPAKEAAAAERLRLPEAGITFHSLESGIFALAVLSEERGALYSAAEADTDVQVLDATILQNGVSFDTESFSIYAIVVSKKGDLQTMYLTKKKK